MDGLSGEREREREREKKARGDNNVDISFVLCVVVDTKANNMMTFALTKNDGADVRVHL